MKKQNEKYGIMDRGIPTPEHKPKNNITEVVFILDRSGSMAGMEEDTIGGFNTMIKNQKAKDGKVYVSTVLFDNECEVLHDRVEIQNVKPMTRENYEVGGYTALFDAIGDAIHHIGNIHKYARSEDVPQNTIFIITTDGMENASRRYSSSEIKHIIKRQTEKFGWEFLFLAANIDAVETAEHIGIRHDRAANYKQSSEGTQHLYETVGGVVDNLIKHPDRMNEYDEGVSFFLRKLDKEAKE